MSAVLTGIAKKSFDAPDDTRIFPNARVEIVNLVGYTVSRSTLLPGWLWSRDVKPTVGTDWCEIEHTGYVAAGQLKVTLRDGTDVLLGPGDFAHIPPYHDAAVIGDVAVVLVDITGGIGWRKP